jgi:hypothetical protein
MELTQFMTITDILRDLQDPETSPGRLSAINMFLAADYTYKTAELQTTLGMKATKWPALREAHGSDKQADKAWDATLEGRLESDLRLQLKSYEKLMSAIKAHLRVREMEARNLH